MWQPLSVRQPFHDEFLREGAAIVEYQSEWSVIFDESTLFQVIDAFRQDLTETHKSALKKMHQLQLQYATRSDEYVVGGFLVPKGSFFRKALPSSHSASLPVSTPLILRFMSLSRAEEMIEEKKRSIKEKFKINQNISKYIKTILRERLTNRLDANFQVSEMNVIYQDIMSSFERDVLNDDNRATIEHLKEVWRIPQYVYIQDPEEALEVRIKIQHVYKEFRYEIMSEETSYFLNLAAMLEMRAALRDDELEEGLTTVELNQQYLELIKDTAIPEEFSLLYGSEAYLEKLASFFKNNGALSTSHSKILARIIIKRIRAFTDQKQVLQSTAK